MKFMSSQKNHIFIVILQQNNVTISSEKGKSSSESNTDYSWGSNIYTKCTCFECNLQIQEQPQKIIPGKSRNIKTNTGI